MMQYVATDKSELAALATGTGANVYAQPGSPDPNQQFVSVLQSQKAAHSISDDTRVRFQPVSTRQGADSPTDKDLKDNASPVKENRVAKPEPEPKPAVTGSSDVEPSSVFAQDWVALVERLAEIAQPTKDYAVEDWVKIQEITEADLRLPNNVEKGLIEQIADRQMFDKLKMTTDGTTNNSSLLQVEDNKVVVNAVQDEQDLNIKDKVVQSLSMLVDDALGEVLTNTKNAGLTNTDVQQKTAELLLEQPEVLQGLFSNLQIADQKNSSDSADTAEQKTLDTRIDNATKKDPRSANLQVDSGGQADLMLAQNKALLRAILVDSETDKNLAQQPVKLVETMLSATPEKQAQTQAQEQAETLIKNLESVTEQGEWLEQDTQLVQFASKHLLNSNKTETVASNSDIKNLLSLTDNKQEKVLENIAQRIFDRNDVGEPVSPEQLVQQVVVPKAAENTNFIGSSAKDFISALKSGLEGFTVKLSQGTESGFDLKALVSEALAKITDTGAVAKAPVNLEQVVNSVSQVLDFAQTMRSAIEHHREQVYSATLRDVAQIQGEQSKQIQLNQFESKIEKAINIAKPEGHQQLAEKVRWMVNTKNLVAEIRLDPAELGSVHVKVAVSGESATVNFVVQSQQARDAVDTATPRLREMLAEKGIELGQSSVRQQSDGQPGQSDGESAKQGGHGKNEAEDVEVPEQVLAQQNIINGALGGIDYFV